jgi:hypothetical protein
MKPHTAYERALKTIARFEKEIAGSVTVTGQKFVEAVSRATVHFAGDEDKYLVLQRSKDTPPVVSCHIEGSSDISVGTDLSVWAETLTEGKFKNVKNNDGMIVDRKYRSWMLIPVTVKKELFLAIVVARKGGRFHETETEAAGELGAYLTQALRDIRLRNKKAATISDDTRHRALLHTQATMTREQQTWPGLSRTIDYSACIGSDIGQFYRNGEDTLLVYTCDVTADDTERQSGLIYLDTWFSILSQTSLDAQSMLQRLNADMMKRAAECYASIALIRYTKKTSRAEIAGCGNTGIIHFSHDQMSARTFGFGAAAGINKDTEIKMQTIAVKPGDIICSFTDGLTGTRKRNGELFGEQAIAEIIRKNYFLSAEDLATKILATVGEMEEKGVNADDRTLQILKIE